MVHWIYVLRCSEPNPEGFSRWTHSDFRVDNQRADNFNDLIFIGETTRLYRRLKEHSETDETGFKKEHSTTKNSSLITHNYHPSNLIGLYNLDSVHKLPNFRKLYIGNLLNNEITYKKIAIQCVNEITIMYMKAINNLYTNVYGGKYNINNRPETNPANNYHSFLRPYCHCKMPADIKIYNSKIYWRCSKKNIWDELNTYAIKLNFYNQKHSVPCNYYKEYNDTKHKPPNDLIYKEPEVQQSENLKILFKQSNWLIDVELNNSDKETCVGGCKRKNDSYLSFKGKKRNLCFNCFIEKNADLKGKYDIYNGKCII